MITLHVSVEELDYILKCLGTRPFQEVHQLIPKLVEQANAPIVAADAADAGRVQ